MRLGIFGGTFDPIHNAHLFIAEEARVRARLDEIVFIPSARPPHKDFTGRTSAEHRYALTRLATESNPRFSASRIELDREGASYTLHTLRALRDGRPDAELFYIIGVDALAEIQTWHRPDEVLREARFLAMSRAGYPTSMLDRLPAPYQARIDRIETVPIHLSSTDLRARIRDGLPVRYLVPESVEQYIRGHGLYAGSQ